MKNPTIHYWGAELLELSGEASPCGNDDENAFITTREQDVTCKPCLQMLAEVQAPDPREMH
jgi:hypothetical protein